MHNQNCLDRREMSQGRIFSIHQSNTTCYEYPTWFLSRVCVWQIIVLPSCIVPHRHGGLCDGPFVMLAWHLGRKIAEAADETYMWLTADMNHSAKRRCIDSTNGFYLSTWATLLKLHLKMLTWFHLCKGMARKSMGALLATNNISSEDGHD